MASAVRNAPQPDERLVWVDGNITKHDPQGLGLLAAHIRSIDAGDRMIDAIVTTIAIAPAGARIDCDEGLDGWDILAPIGAKGPQVWREAADVLYATSFADAALDLCHQSARDDSPAIIARALKAVLRQPHRLASSDSGGVIARHIVAELVQAQARPPH